MFAALVGTGVRNCGIAGNGPEARPRMAWSAGWPGCRSAQHRFSRRWGDCAKTADLRDVRTVKAPAAAVVLMNARLSTVTPPARAFLRRTPRSFFVSASRSDMLFLPLVALAVRCPRMRDGGHCAGRRAVGVGESCRCPGRSAHGSLRNAIFKPKTRYAGNFGGSFAARTASRESLAQAECALRGRRRGVPRLRGAVCLGDHVDHQPHGLAFRIDELLPVDEGAQRDRATVAGSSQAGAPAGPSLSDGRSR